ncbi:MAG TPA: TonB-dependent receptor [Terriglobales bacterium]|nr:TonB-dependent receptor [Terriglobales bacterium]
MRLLLALLIVSSTALGAAQTVVEGAVHDSSGNPVRAAKVLLERTSGVPGHINTTDDNGRFHFAAVDAGAYRLKTEAPGFYTSDYELTVRPRQPVTLTIELQPAKTAQQTVEVKALYRAVDPEKTGSSQTFTHEDLERLPDPLVENTNALVANLTPGASQSHDNFINVRGNEFSLHEFINGVSFLDNTQPQFGPGVSPQIFETVDLMTGGFAPEYGNRFGGVLDITTRSGATMQGQGDVNFRGATVSNYDLNADYGGQIGKIGYYLFADGFTSGRYLDPPEPGELHDFGQGSRATAQLDWHSSKDTLKLLLMGGGTNFQQPNLTEDQLVGRDADRHLRQHTAILNWLHNFSSNTLISTSFYERLGSDRVLPTTDPVTPLSIASRSTLTVGIKSDLFRLWHNHVLKGGIELLRLRELESFFFDSRGDPDVFPPFSAGRKGGQASAYLQDHFSPFRNLWVDVGARYDHFQLVQTGVHLSPRLGLAYHVNRTNTAIHAAYNRFFSPPPIEYSLLASFIGHNAIDPSQRVGDVRAYTQNYFEVGLAQELHPRISLEVNAYLHTGHNSFENHEISISRIFLPINFHTARSTGAELIMNMRQLERLGISGRFQYAVARTFFYGPVTGGFTGDEILAPGERIMPAFDQTHTGTAQLFYHNRWRSLWAGSAMRYGSGTVVERGPRLPQHLTADLATGLNLWSTEPRRLDLELDITNVSDSRYKIAKESEEIPIQYAPSRTIGGSLKFHF